MSQYEVASATMNGKTAKRLGRLITDLTKHAVSKKALPLALAGLCFEASEDGALKITGGDGFKIISVTIPLDFPANVLKNALRTRPVFPPSLLADVVKPLKAAKVKDDVEIQFTWTPAYDEHPEGATFHVVRMADAGAITVGGQSMVASYPDYARLFEKAEPFKGEYERAAFSAELMAQTYTALRECGQVVRFRSLRTTDPTFMEIIATEDGDAHADNWAAQALVMPFFLNWDK